MMAEQISYHAPDWGVYVSGENCDQFKTKWRSAVGTTVTGLTVADR